MKFIKQLIGYTIKASDGDIGAVEEFYFDEDAWRVAYALVNLSDISERRHVLISLDTFMEPDWKRKRFLINATRELVRQSPDADRGLLSAIGIASDVTSYYDWPVYWNPAGAITPSMIAGKQQRAAVIEESVAVQQLRGVKALIGFKVTGDDGTIGRLDDFVVDDVMWDIRSLAILFDRAGEEGMIQVSPDMVSHIYEARGELSITLRKELVRKNTSYNVLYEKIPEQVQK